MQWLISGVHALSSVLRVGNVHFVDYMARRGEQILYLPAPVSPLHFLLRRGDQRFRERSVLWRRGPNEKDEHVLEYAPMTLLPVLAKRPFDSSFALKRSLRWTIPRLRSVLDKAGFREPDVLVTTNLQYAYLDQQVSPRRHVYWCKDDIHAFSHAPRCLLQAEEDLLKRVDLSIATSEYLAERLRARGGKQVVCVRNGADVKRFVSGDARKAPAAITELPEPRIIYAGIINERVNLDWIVAAASRLPEAQFLLVGPAAMNLSALTPVENIHILGAVAPSKLPGIYAACQVGIIPFRRTPLVESTCPIKLYEYLSAGLPVVATRWSEPESIDDADAFSSALCEALDSANDSRATAARKAYAAGNSWESRFNAMRDIIQSADDA
ncbi:MAG: glycosyltransferase [Candidatus Sumerlaeota bacterium]